jgi:hypothetical protein
MPKFPPDEILLDFDHSDYPEWNQHTSDLLLVEQPEVYRNHLAIANWLEGFAARMTEAQDLDEEWREGHAAALHDIAAHLRQGDFVPGRAMYED